MSLRAPKLRARRCDRPIFYSATLQRILLQSKHQVPKNTVARDVLACKRVGFAAMPSAVCDLCDAAPSRNLWKAMLLQWLRQVGSTCTGVFGHYYATCCLDRLLAVEESILASPAGGLPNVRRIGNGAKSFTRIVRISMRTSASKFFALFFSGSTAHVLLAVFQKLWRRLAGA